jgi:hypothetical protein
MTPCSAAMSSCGKHVWGAGWAHDGSARGKNKTGYGNTWVVAAIIVQVPFSSRPIALPVTARMWRSGAGPSRCELALTMICSLKEVLGERLVHVVADAAYHHRDVASLPDGITWTTRLPVNAALTGPRPEREPGRRGRPRKKGDRLGTLTQIAAAATWNTATLTKYGKTVTVRLAVIDVQWYGPWKDLPARLILLKRKLSLLRPGPDHHRPDRHRAAGRAELRRPLGHRGRLPGHAFPPRRRPGPQPDRPRREPDHPVHPGRLHHHPALVRRTRPPTAAWRPGTRPRPNRPTPTS